MFVAGVPALLLGTRDRPKRSCLLQAQLAAKRKRACRAHALIDEKANLRTTCSGCDLKKREM